MSGVLAETVSFTEEEMLFIMMVLLAILAVAVTLGMLGCLWAWMAGKGSQRALGGWIFVAMLEVPAVIAALPGAVEGSLFAILPLGIVALQVALYLAGRRRRLANREPDGA